ncbi:MAG: tRNA 2-thiouridine(34) synthase MnmA [Ruminococcaceae bacterium]|nr:tRNA 2-thiouridine(34) synthase MnmA [Oscillospiraceae bacterium]
MKKAIIAMSGGVDSSVAALLTKKMGYECGGVMMRFSACPNDSSEDAREIAKRLSMPFYLFDLSHEFEERVIKKFISEYERGATPNPCVECNRHLKFEELFKRCEPLGYDTLVTGHYARITKDISTGRYMLKKGVFTPKDQSYVLYNMTQTQLSRTLFPMGELTKEEARQIAAENGFINSQKPDSQDICFVPDGDYVSFIKNYTKKEYAHGDFVDTSGKILGRHRGIINYTVGQRRGLGLALPAPLYVKSKNVEENKVVLCPNDELFQKSIVVGDINWIDSDKIPEAFRAAVRIRYNQKETPCSARLIDEGRLLVTFDQPQRAPTVGQAVVFYDADTVLGGGTLVE